MVKANDNLEKQVMSLEVDLHYTNLGGGRAAHSQLKFSSSLLI
jgi:hypothetical protein